MPYSDFTLEKVKKAFNLTEKRVRLFENVTKIESSDWLKETFDVTLELALSSSSEKARSEFIVVPILVEMEKRNKKAFAIYSGNRLDVNEEKGLNGECDFILSRGPVASTIQAPIFSLVEAKKNDIQAGLGQCIAQMVGANLFNQKEENGISSIYGCVTTGENWQFLQLENDIIFMDINRYYINDVNTLLGIFQKIIDS
jgi:hypothetical protein